MGGREGREEVNEGLDRRQREVGKHRRGSRAEVERGFGGVVGMRQHGRRAT